MKENEAKQYLEIYPSEVAAQKISAHLDKMLSGKPKVYKKTIDRYKRLAAVLLDCLDKINRFIETESLLSSSDAEFNELGAFAEDSINLSSNIDTLKQQVERTNRFTSSHIISSNSDINSPSVNACIAQYSAILQTGANLDFGYDEINQCARLINMWFQSRIPKSAADSDFRYNLRQFPVCISQIIITYGWYFDQGKVYDLEQEFRRWCKEVKEDRHNIYTVPYCVYHIANSEVREHYTLSAVLIADVLYEKCYYSLNSIIKPNTEVAAIVKSINPALSGAIRSRVNKQGELLELLEFTSTAHGGNV